LDVDASIPAALFTSVEASLAWAWQGHQIDQHLVAGIGDANNSLSPKGSWQK
jgi:hypothetical protein